jgi:hypothetical protein
VSTGDHGETTLSPPAARRYLLRELAGTQMWHIAETRPRPGHRLPTIYYEVISASGVKTFGRPHQAWEYFQKLTNAPSARPEP